MPPLQWEDTVRLVGVALTDVIGRTVRRHGHRRSALRALATMSGAAAGGSTDADGDEWLGLMVGRFQSFKAEAAAHEQADDVAAAAAELYPDGAAPGAVEDAFRAFRDAAGATLSDHALTGHAESVKGSGGRLSRRALQDAFIAGPLAESVAGPTWWVAPRDALTVRRVACLADPPTLLVEYEVATAAGAALRHRRFFLEGTVRPAGGLQPVAKRLALAHPELFTAAEWTTHLGRLQRVLVQAKGGPATKIAAAAPVEAGPKKADIGLLYRNPEEALKDVDLQDADETALAEFKSKMDTGFKAHTVRPGDKGYEYDRRVVAKPTAKSGWDSDSD